MRLNRTAETVKNIPSKSELLTAVFSQWDKVTKNLAIEKIALSQAEKRIVAKYLFSHNCLPIYRSANMDGIAICFDSLQKENFVEWEENIDYCMADTGDDFVEPFDTVVPIEAVDILPNGGIHFHDDIVSQIEKGQYISFAGSKIGKGEMLVQEGMPLSPLQLNLLAMGGYMTVPVFQKPKVTYIPTGSELISAGIPPKRGENIASNCFMVEQMARNFGADILSYPVCKDIQRDLEDLMERALLEADVVLINGGSSKGSEDYNTSLIEKRSDYFLHYARSAPGFPVGVGLIDQKFVVNLPGPPTATFAIMHWLVRPLVEKASGQKQPIRHLTYATLTEGLTGSDIMDLYIYAHIEKRVDGLYITPSNRKTRPALQLGTSNAIIVLAAQAHYQAGDLIEAEWI